MGLSSRSVTRSRSGPASTRSPWGWAAGGAVLGLLAATVWHAPARWFTQPLEKAAQGRLLFDDARGTLWRGSARLTLTGGAGSSDAATLPGRLTWEIWPAWPGLMARIRADCCMAEPWPLKLQPQWGGARIDLGDAQSQWPAHWLTGLGTPWNTVQASGQLVVTTQGLSLAWTQGRLTVVGQAQVQALQISSRLSTLSPMGSYRLRFQGGPAPAFSLETMEGSLQLSGRGQWVGGRLRFEGDARAVPERLDALSNLLNIIGRREGARAIIKLG